MTFMLSHKSIYFEGGNDTHALLYYNFGICIDLNRNKTGVSSEKEN